MLIGLSGRAGSGKDTAALRLVEHYGFRRLAFADPLKEDLARRFDRTIRAYLSKTDPDACVRAWKGGDEDWWQRRVRRALTDKDPVIRALLQNYGTDVRRADDDRYWIKKWEVALSERPGGHFVTTDVRFENELVAVLTRGGRLVRITRPGFDGGGGHSSETGLDSFNGWDFTLLNDGSVEDLWRKVDEMMRTFQA